MLRAIQRGWRWPGWINRLLYPLSLLYAGVMLARRHAYRMGILTRHKLPVPVVVVGNISVGGTGKTPLLMELVEDLKSRGMMPGVISRGYRRRGGLRSSSTPFEVGEDDTAAQVGDEPLLIYRRCRVPVAVGANRMRGARLLLHRHRCNIILSDDGFQHLALQRDIDIAVIDGERGFGNGWCLPAGPLREPVSALKRADIIVIHNSNHNEREREYDESGASFNMHTHIDQAVRADGGETRALREFAEGTATVHALAGIGNPGRFFRQLEGYGINVVAHEFPDHHTFTTADIESVAAAAGCDTPILMTEKDAVKCETLMGDGELAKQCWTVPLQVDLEPGLAAAVFERVTAANANTATATKQTP